MGAAFVALLFISGQLGGPAGAVSESRPGEGPLLLSGLRLQVSVTSELRAGEAPLLPDANPRSFVAEILTPRLGLELRRPDFTFQLFYGPSIFWEDPNPISTGARQILPADTVTRVRGQVPISVSGSGPLILHSADLVLDARPSRDVSLTASANGSIGSPDYTALPLVLGTVQGTLPPIVSLMSGTAQASVRAKASRRWELALTAQLFHWQWLDVPETLPASIITGQTLVSAEPSATLRLSARDSLGLGTTVAEAWYSDGAGLGTITPALTWRRHVTPRADLRLTLGLTYAHALGPTPPGAVPLLGSSRSATGPIGSFELISRLVRRDQIMILGGAGGAVDFYVDPVLGTAGPRGAAGAGLTAISAPRWMISLRGDFATALRTTPYPTLVGGIAPDETAFYLSLFVRRWVSKNLMPEIGARWADRGPALVTPDFGFHQREIWIYLALTATTQPIARLVH